MVTLAADAFHQMVNYSVHTSPVERGLRQPAGPVEESVGPAFQPGVLRTSPSVAFATHLVKLTHNLLLVALYLAHHGDQVLDLCTFGEAANCHDLLYDRRYGNFVLTAARRPLGSLIENLSQVLLRPHWVDIQIAQEMDDLTIFHQTFKRFPLSKAVLVLVC